MNETYEEYNLIMIKTRLILEDLKDLSDTCHNSPKEAYSLFPDKAFFLLTALDMAINMDMKEMQRQC